MVQQHCLTPQEWGRKHSITVASSVYYTSTLTRIISKSTTIAPLTISSHIVGPCMNAWVASYMERGTSYTMQCHSLLLEWEMGCMQFRLKLLVVSCINLPSLVLFLLHNTHTHFQAWHWAIIAPSNTWCGWWRWHFVWIYVDAKGGRQKWFERLLVKP